MFLGFIGLAIESTSRRNNVSIRLFGEVAKVCVAESVRVMAILASFVAKRYAKMSKGHLSLTCHVNGAFSVAFTRLIVFSFLGGALQNVSGRRIIVIAVLFRRRGRNEGAYTRRGVNERSSGNVSIILLGRITASFTFSFAVFVDVTARRGPIEGRGHRSSIQFGVVRFVGRGNMVDFTFEDCAVVLRAYVRFAIINVPLLEVKKVTSGNVRMGQFTSIATINLREPIFFREINAANVSIVQFSAARRRIRAYRIMDIFLRLLHVMFRLILILSVTPGQFASDGRREA